MKLSAGKETGPTDGFQAGTRERRDGSSVQVGAGGFVGDVADVLTAFFAGTGAVGHAPSPFHPRARIEIPEDHGLFPTYRGQTPAIGAEGDGYYGLLMPAQKFE